MLRQNVALEYPSGGAVKTNIALLSANTFSVAVAPGEAVTMPAIGAIAELGWAPADPAPRTRAATVRQCSFNTDLT